MNTLGYHIIAELSQCSSSILDNYDKIKSIIERGAMESGATIIGSVFNKFVPCGVTGIVAISESHISIHTWPEFRYASLDIYTCGNINPFISLDYIREKLECKKTKTTVLQRGILKDDNYDHIICANSRGSFLVPS